METRTLTDSREHARNRMRSRYAVDEADFDRRYIHGLFCNRTLNLRSIQAIGYDMDYTLIHYRMSEWENRAYDHLKARLN